MEKSGEAPLMVRMILLGLVIGWGTVICAATPTHADKLPQCDCNELSATAPVWRLMLYAKDPTTWRIIPTGPRGELTIHRQNGSFRFHASGLPSGIQYGLCHYPGNGNVGTLLAQGRTSPGGLLDITGSGPVKPGKIWLVRYDDLAGVTGSLAPGAPVTLRSWHPASYLFESEALP